MPHPPCVRGDIIPILSGAILIVHGPGNEADTIVNTALAITWCHTQRVRTVVNRDNVETLSIQN